MANKWATACPFVVLANLSWENNMTESSVIYFPPRPLESRGEMEKVAKQTDAQRQLAILSLMWRSSSNGHLPQAKPSQAMSSLDSSRMRMRMRLRLWLRLWLMKCMQIPLRVFDLTWL